MAALAGGLLALSAFTTPAKADDCGTSFTRVQVEAPGFTALCGDKKYDNFDGFDFNIPYTVIFSEPVPLTHLVSFTFGTAPGTGLVPGTYNFDYDITVTTYPAFDIASTTTSFTGSGQIGTITSDQSINPAFPGGGPVYTATAETVVGPNSNLQEWNLFVTQTPGPLPVLGAGAAFGFSRKLRKRIKQSA